MTDLAEVSPSREMLLIAVVVEGVALREVPEVGRGIAETEGGRR